MMRKETVSKVASAIMDAMNDKKLRTVADIEKIINVATLTDAQKEKLDERIKAKKAELDALNELKKAVE